MWRRIFRPTSNSHIEFAHACRRHEDARGFVQRLLVFLFRHGIGHDARPCVEIRGSLLNDHGADCDIELALAIESEIADGTRVKAARLRLQLRNDLSRAPFRGTRDRAAGEATLQSRWMVDLSPELSLDGGNKVEYLLVALEV